MKYGEQRTTGLTRTFAERDAGGSVALDRAVSKGEVTVTVDDCGTEFFFKKSMATVRKVGGKDESRVGGSQAITEDLAKEAIKQLKSMEIEFINASSKKALNNGAGGRGNVPIPTDVLNKMQKQKNIAEKQLKDSSEVLKMYGKADMKLLSDARGKEAELRAAIVEVGEALSPVTIVLLMNEVSVPESAVVSPSEYLNILMAKLVSSLKKCFENMEFGKSMYNKLKIKSQK